MLELRFLERLVPLCKVNLLNALHFMSGLLSNWLFSSPGGTMTLSAGTAATTAAPVPTDAQPQTNTNCGE